MRAPDSLYDLTVENEVAPGPYPPQGFVPITEAALGNGDCFGLYWPLGREAEPPVVCEMFHDEWRMEMSHSSLDVFAQWLERNGWGDDEAWENREHDAADASSPLTMVERAYANTVAGKPEEAIPLLEAACRAFPDMQKGWALLAGQLLRVGDRLAATRAARSALLSNWAFGVPEAGVLRILQSAEDKDDPVVIMAKQLRLAFGGAKTNPDYALMQVCIDNCWMVGDMLAALRLSQNRCYVLAGETVSFQERERFDRVQWQRAFGEQCRVALGDDRQSFG